MNRSNTTHRMRAKRHALRQAQAERRLRAEAWRLGLSSGLLKATLAELRNRWAAADWLDGALPEAT